MSERIDAHGKLAYRTKLLLRPQAEQFAAALRANPRFSEVYLVQSDRAKSERRFYVEWQPSSERAREQMLVRQIDARAERAASQEFTFVLDKDGGRPFFHCHSHASGEVYTLTEQGCDCPDATFRCRPQNIDCKHVHALKNAIHSGAPIEAF